MKLFTKIISGKQEQLNHNEIESIKYYFVTSGFHKVVVTPRPFDPMRVERHYFFTKYFAQRYVERRVNE